MNPANKSLIRGLFKLIAGALVAWGLIDAQTSEQVEGQLDLILDGVVAVAGGLMFIAAQFASRKAKQAESKEAKQIAATVAVAGVPIKTEVAAAMAAVKGDTK